MMKSSLILSEKNVSLNPIDQFHYWYSEHIGCDPEDSGVMTLATSVREGVVSARIVLLKEYNENGFIFYTNYESRKGIQLQQNPHAALLFYWPELSRQVRIEGTVEKVPSDISDRYFKTRPRGSRISAIASNQSRIIPDKDYLLGKVAFIRKNIKGKNPVRPDYWGGYRLIPSWFEFWLEGKNRLHDRISYTLVKDKWIINRLAS